MPFSQRHHRRIIFERDKLVRQVSCPRCESASGAPCVGLTESSLVGVVLAVHHVERHAWAGICPGEPAPDAPLPTLSGREAG